MRKLVRGCFQAIAWKKPVKCIQVSLCSCRGTFWVLNTGYGLRPELSSSETISFPSKGICRRGGVEAGTAAADDPLIGDPTTPVSIHFDTGNITSYILVSLRAMGGM